MQTIRLGFGVIILVIGAIAYGQQSGIVIEKNSNIGNLEGSHLLLFETENDFARLRFSNNLYDAGTNKRFWDIASRISSGGDLFGDRMNFYSSEAGDVLSLRADGRVGIRTLNPSRTLDINGDLNLLKEQPNGKALFVNGGEALALNGGKFEWGAGGTQNIFSSSIGVKVNPAQRDLHVDGFIRSNALSGVGNRKLVANTSGDILAVDNELKYISIPPASFHDPEHIQGSRYIATELFANNNNTYAAPLIAPLLIPHGARISHVTIYFEDDLEVLDLSFKIGRRLHSSLTVQASDESITKSSAGQPGVQSITISSFNSPDFSTIDNANYSYYFIAQVVKASNPQDPEPWSILNLRSVVVAYYE